jgi:hypothetical protein
LASIDELDRACELGRSSLDAFRDVLGADHPHTLACAANLALDLRATKRLEEADALSAATNERYAETLGPDHPDTLAASTDQRLDFDFEPPPL